MDKNTLDRDFVQQWSEFIDKHPDGNIFQSPGMFELFQKTSNFTPVVLSSFNNEGVMKGVLLAVIINEKKGPARYFSSRAVVYGGPLTDQKSGRQPEIADDLLNQLVKKVGSKTIFIQFRNFFDMDQYTEVFKRYGFVYRERLNYLVDTSSAEQLRKNMSKSKLRQVKRGLDSGAELIMPKSIEQVREFYDILHDLYKTKVKKPLPAWGFFRNFYELSKEEKLGIIQLVSFQNKIIGGILCPHSPGKTLFEWYVCGLDEEYRKQYPSVLATWAGLKYAADHNIASFDFMGVGLPGKEYGVRDFKARFGGEMVNYGRYSRINNKINYHIAELGYNFLAIFRQV